jgi:hypothetical protein
VVTVKPLPVAIVPIIPPEYASLRMVGRAIAGRSRRLQDLGRRCYWRKKEEDGLHFIRSVTRGPRPGQEQKRFGGPNLGSRCTWPRHEAMRGLRGEA